MSSNKSRVMFGLAGGVVVAGAALTITNWNGRVADATPAPAPAPAASGEFELDGVHTSVVFKIKHMGVSNFYGVFKDVSGSFSMGESAGVDVTVKSDSVDTRNGKRDEHVKSPDFFSAKEFPTMTFKAQGLKKGGDGNYSGKGDLTFRGVTKAIDVVITPTGTGKGRGGAELAGFETRFTIKRSDFGNSSMIGPLSDEVEVIVAAEGSTK